MGMGLTQEQAGFGKRSGMTVDTEKGWKHCSYYFDESRSVGEAGCVTKVALLKDEREEELRSYKV